MFFEKRRTSPPAAPWASLILPEGLGHVAAARKRSHKWCVSLTPNNTETIWRTTCHCFLWPIRRDLTSSSHTTWRINPVARRLTDLPYVTIPDSFCTSTQGSCSQIRTVISALSVTKQSWPRRSLKWNFVYHMGVHTIRDRIFRWHETHSAIVWTWSKIR